MPTKTCLHYDRATHRTGNYDPVEVITDSVPVPCLRSSTLTYSNPSKYPPTLTDLAINFVENAPENALTIDLIYEKRLQIQALARDIAALDAEIAALDAQLVPAFPFEG